MEISEIAKRYEAALIKDSLANGLPLTTLNPAKYIQSAIDEAGRERDEQIRELEKNNRWYADELLRIEAESHD